MTRDFICCICDRTFCRDRVPGRFVQIRKLCDNCLVWHKWCQFGSHAPIRSRFAVCAKSKDDLQATCNGCLPWLRGRKLYQCIGCDVEFLQPLRAHRLNGRGAHLCEDCYPLMKHCRKCDKVKPKLEFCAAPDKACGTSAHCRECVRASWHVLPIERRAMVKLAKFGLTYSQYTAMREACGDLCMICGSPETGVHQNGKVKPLAIDHCHATGVVRGLLCHPCNAALGYMRDNPTRLRAAANYLDRFLSGVV